MNEPFTSLSDTADVFPYEYYASAREQGDLVWDERVHAWVAATYASVKEVFTDEERFARPTPRDVAGDLGAHVFGLKHPSSLVGDEHTMHRRWWLGLFRPSSVDRYRTEVMRPVINSAIERFERRGTAELVSEFTSYVTGRVVAGVLGLPWDDDAWMLEISKQFNIVEEWKGDLYLRLGEAADKRALDAANSVDDLLREFMEVAKATDNGTLISRMWRDDALRGWSEEEIYGLVRTFFSAGNVTTRTSMSNALYLMLTTEGLANKLRSGDGGVMQAFVEEAIRLHGTVHFRTRLVRQDTSIQGCPVVKGDVVAAVMASANRDERQFPNASLVDLARGNAREHLAFSAGIGACAGMALARAELAEGVSNILDRLPDLRLDPAAEPPSIHGLLFRWISPINVRFSPLS